MNKLEQQACGKADLSYSYWAARPAGEAPAPQPKKLTAEEAAAQQQQLKHTELGASAWNAAGTFEERNLSVGWVREQLGELLAQLQHSSQGVEVAVTEVTACSGEAHQWIVRGKKRAGFELNFEFKWRAQLAGSSGSGAVAVSGTAKVPHAAADELDELELEVKLDAGGAASSTAGGAADSTAGTGDGAGSGEVGELTVEVTAAQRQHSKAAVSGMVPKLEAALQQLLERMQQK